MLVHRARRIENILIASGIALMALFLGLFVEREWYQQEYMDEMRRASESPVTPSTGKTRRSGAGALVGAIVIPRLELSAAILDGVDATTLRRGVGHVPGTAYPGDKGNVVLAAHRDTFFRKLQMIRVGDKVRLVRGGKQAEYEVDDIEIVRPEQTEVMSPTSGKRLTLITCYPFQYVGNAPERYVVHAKAGVARRAHARYPQRN